MISPDPYHEIRPVGLRSLRGANFWSRRPVTRLDLEVGAFDEISSAEAPGVREALYRVLPGLIEHQCSVGERGGFLTRLRRGTYAPHIIEHIALELQMMIGHDVAYGRTRGGDRAGEYTVVFEHEHAEVGMRAAALALDVVRRAFAGALGEVGDAVDELRALARTPDTPASTRAVLCGITGGGDRAAARDELRRRGAEERLVIDVAPGRLLDAGLPYARSIVGMILDARPIDVPDRYREEDRAQRLVSVVADAVPRGGIVVVPAKEWEVQEMVRAAQRRVAIFSGRDDVEGRDARMAHAVALPRDGRIMVEREGQWLDLGEARPGVDVAAQVAGALAWLAIEETKRNGGANAAASGAA